MATILQTQLEMNLYSKKWLRPIILIVFFAISIEGFSENETLIVPVIQSPDKNIDFLLHPDNNSFDINPYYPKVPDWQNSIFRKENKPEIDKAIFLTDPEIIKKKIKADPCLADFAKSVQSGLTSKQFAKSLENTFDPYEIEQNLEMYYAQRDNKTSLHWTKRGPLVQQVPLILKHYKDFSSKQKLIIEYLRTENHYYLQLSIVCPGIELMERTKIRFIVGNRLDTRSCKITDESMDSLTKDYFTFLKTVTTPY